jgi:acetyltransferase-like isoleucine patch superfamily enzyme
LIYPNVEIGPDSVVEEGVVVGQPPRGAEPGDLPTRLGAGSVLRSGTVIYAGVEIGDAFRSGHRAVVRERNRLGDRCGLGDGAVLEVGNRIGDDSLIGAGCVLEYVSLGSRVSIGPHVIFTDDPHPVCPRYTECVLGATVEDDVSIGANSILFPGIRIGAGAAVAPGSMVAWQVPAGARVQGSPARISRTAPA